MSIYTDSFLTELAFIRHVAEGYLEAAYFTADDDVKHAPLSPDAAAQALTACANFIAQHRDLFLQYMDCKLGAHRFGEDLWLTRNRHGAGFFDRAALPDNLRASLQQAAHQLGSCDLIIQGDFACFY